MKGERLYERFCGALKAEQDYRPYAQRPNVPELPVAWSHLPLSERRVWNAVARELAVRVARRAGA